MSELPKLVVGLTYDEAMKHVVAKWPDVVPTGLRVVVTDGRENGSSLAGYRFTEDEVEWSPRASEGRLFPRIKALVNSCTVGV